MNIKLETLENKKAIINSVGYYGKKLSNFSYYTSYLGTYFYFFTRNIAPKQYIICFSTTNPKCLAKEAYTKISAGVLPEIYISREKAYTAIPKPSKPSKENKELLSNVYKFIINND